MPCLRSSWQHTGSRRCCVWHLCSWGKQTLSCVMWDIASWPGIEAGPPALAAWCLRHWTAGRPQGHILKSSSEPAGAQERICRSPRDEQTPLWEALAQRARSTLLEEAAGPEGFVQAVIEGWRQGQHLLPEGVSESRSVTSDSLRPHGLYSPWNSPGQNTAVGSLSLRQGIFPTQVSHIAGGFFTSWATGEAQENWSG